MPRLIVALILAALAANVPARAQHMNERGSIANLGRRWLILWIDANTPGNPFKGRQYSGEVILLAMRWYLRYPLAYEHVAEMLAERGPCGGCQLRLAVGPSVCTGTQ